LFRNTGDQEGEDQSGDWEGEDQGHSADDHQYPGKSFIVVAIYQGDCYISQMLDKKGKPEAKEIDCYLLVSFMEKM
jgi:hypothetical protein